MITIRPLTLDDVDSTYFYSSTLDNTYYMLMCPHKSKDETRAFIEKCIPEYDKEEPEFWSFAVEYEGKHVGEVFAYLSREEADIGWLISKDFWGQGIATKAAKLLVKLLKEKLNVKSIVSYCDERNVPSRKVMEHLGMVYAGKNGMRYYDKDVTPAEELKYIMP